MHDLITYAKLLIIPPNFEDQETETRNARLLYAIGWTGLFAGTIYSILHILLFPAISYPLAYLALAYAVTLIALGLARRGQVTTGSTLLISSAWLFLGIAAIEARGVTPTIVSGYCLVVICAGLILGQRQILVFTGLSLLVELGLTAWNLNHLAGTPLRTASWLALAASSAILMMITLMLMLARESLERSLTRLYCEIDQRGKVELALRKSEARYKVISEISADYTYEFVVAPTGQIDLEWVTDSFVRMSGYDSYDAVRRLGGMPVLVHPDDMPLVRRRIASLLAGQTDVSDLRLRRKNGEIVWIRDFGRGIWSDEQKRVTGIIGAAQDITPIKEAQLSMESAHHDLREAYDKTIEGWVRMIDLRDHETQGHTMRVMELAVQLARALHVEEQELIHIRRGALMHDIGKIAVPDRILRKRGPLNARELEIMRRHPVYAREILSPIDYLRQALPIPYHHHERWDGSGYPDGLRGEKIPLAARLFAVVDVWDALCSDRPYRKKWSHEKARAYLLETSGQLFDRRIVKTFLSIIADCEPDQIETLHP